MKKKKIVNVNKEKPSFDNYWSKVNVLILKGANRPLEYYVFNYRRNLSISSYIIGFCVLLFVMNIFILYKKVNENKLIFTTINGSVYDYRLDQSKVSKIKEAIGIIQNRQQQPSTTRPQPSINNGSQEAANNNVSDSKIQDNTQNNQNN